MASDPGVFLNRAAKKCEFSVGSSSRPPPSCGSGGDARGSRALSRVALGTGVGVRPRPLARAGKGRGPRVESLLVWSLEAPKLFFLLPHVPPRTLRNVSKTADRISLGSKD